MAEGRPWFRQHAAGERRRLSSGVSRIKHGVSVTWPARFFVARCSPVRRRGGAQGMGGREADLSWRGMSVRCPFCHEEGGPCGLSHGGDPRERAVRREAGADTTAAASVSVFPGKHISRAGECCPADVSMRDGICMMCWEGGAVRRPCGNGRARPPGASRKVCPARQGRPCRPWPPPRPARWRDRKGTWKRCRTADRRC